MELTPILYESHSHTPLCKHARGEPEAYAAIAEERGLKGIIFTCHSPMPNRWAASVRMAPEDFETYVACVERARKTWAGRVDVRLGMESDYFPGMESWLEKLHQRAEFHHILGSVHPQMSEYREAFYRGDWLDFQATYFGHLATAAETGLFDTLAHPDLVKIVVPRPEWILSRIMDKVTSALDRIAACGVAMELNTSGLYKVYPEMNPGPDILREMRTRNIPVVIGADAHSPDRVADKFDQALDLLVQAGYNSIRYFLNRQPVDVPIEAALHSLKSRQPLAAPVIV
jgi:histidinol-phosphatase (PHP family)